MSVHAQDENVNEYPQIAWRLRKFLLLIMQFYCDATAPEWPSLSVELLTLLLNMFGLRGN